MLFGNSANQRPLFGNPNSAIENHSPRAVDFVDLGDSASEKKHQGLGAWSIRNKAASADYGGAQRVTNAPFPLMCRDFSTTAGVVLVVQPKRNVTIRINAYDNSYNIGQKAKPTKVMISFNGKDWTEIGTFRITGINSKWDTFSYRIPAKDVPAPRLHVLLDDNANFKSGKFGKSLHFIDAIHE